MDILVKNIEKSFGQQAVLKDFSFTFPAGKTTCIMGESGCGKTTLLRILMGLEKPDGGSISGIQKGRVGAVFQEDRLCENLSAAANLRLVRKHLPQEEIEEAFREVRLEDAWKKPVRELSGGMKRRVAILRALLAEADCIIMDEPLKGLDEETKEQTIRYIRSRTDGKTLIVVTHEEKEAEMLGAHEILRMRKIEKGITTVF